MRPELLAPAGSPAAMHAAVQNGADAVYLGCGDFNARRNAKNFTQEELYAAVRYCHLRGVKVYLTLNTLLFDREFPAAAQFIAYAAKAGIDAVLVQDLGVLRMVRAVAPELPCHASTQMSIHNADGARAAKALGLSRVVLAREMPAEEIAAVCAIEGLETEVFVHGAHCMCYSGQCAMSALIGGRSGNRGTCAQPCRLPYRMDGKQGYPLSLKDLCLADHIPALTKLGVSCLKLEGRMKRAEYVAVVTHIYASLLRENRPPTEEERKALADAFSRNGFTDGYFEGHTGRQMFGVRPQNVKEPRELFEKARQTYEEDTFHAPVAMELSILREQPACLTVHDARGHTISVNGPVPEDAIHRALDADDLKKRLAKTGGTCFSADEITVHLDEGLSLPVSAINALRRDALDALTERRCAVPLRHVGNYIPRKKTNRGPETAPAFTVSISSPRQLTKDLLAEAPARIDFPLELLSELDSDLFGHAPLCAVLPRIYQERDRAKLRTLLEQAHEKGVTQAAISNLGHFDLVAGLPLSLCGDFGLNVVNSETLSFLRDHDLTSATVSFELRREQIRDLDKVLPLEAIVYGRLPLMITENQLNPPGKIAVLTDRTGANFPVLSVFGQRSEVENSKTLFLADKNDYQKLGLTYARLRFTDESPAECVEILRRYRRFDGQLPREYTRGLFYRSVE